MMKVILFIVLLAPMAAQASQIERAFKGRNYKRVTNIYRAAPNKKLSNKEMILISYSLRKQKLYREDIKFLLRLIKRYHLKKHITVLRAIRSGDDIDSDEIPNSLKIHYWNLFNDFAHLIRAQDEKTGQLLADQKYFMYMSKILGEIEFRENKVDRTTDAITAHIQNIENKIYHFKTSLFLQYVSWQNSALLEGPNGNTDLVITNRGLCPGGQIGLENHRFHFYLDGCFLYGAGGVKSTGDTTVDYQQANLPAYGFKGGPGASVIVSSSRSRLGIKIPVLWSIQKLTDPLESQYNVSQVAELSVLTTLYSHFQFGQYFLHTEFGKYVQKEETFWGIGFGREF